MHALVVLGQLTARSATELTRELYAEPIAPGGEGLINPADDRVTGRRPAAARLFHLAFGPFGPRTKAKCIWHGHAK